MAGETWIEIVKANAQAHGEIVVGIDPYLPDIPAVFEPKDGGADWLPHYLNFQLYQILLEAKASEHSSRMVAMKNATDNAKQLIKDLTLEYNKVRQANITRELLEITSAAMALG